jgi:hypothetical protein
MVDLVGVGPAGSGATVFAIVVTSFIASGSAVLGAWLFEVANESYGADAGFGLAVALSVAAAMSCWLFIPAIRQAAPQWWEQMT